MKTDTFKVIRYVGVLAVALTFYYHQFIALPAHMWLARGLSLLTTLMLGFYEFFIYRREMRRRKQEDKVREEARTRETIRLMVSEEATKQMPINKNSSRSSVSPGLPTSHPTTNEEQE